MNKIAVVSMVKNEEDIIESFVRHALQFADKLFICDHKSSDRTRDILDALKSEGLSIEISSFDRDEKAQSEITNKLLNHAFSEGFDLVIPLDADEFPIYIGGNSKDLRKCFQALNTSQYYRIPLYECRFADSDESQFAFSRSIVREKTISKVPPKVIIGRIFAKLNLFRVAQGNHSLEFASTPKMFLNVEKVCYAHFALRSSSQMIQKHAINWLNTLLRAGRYTPWSAFGRNFMRQYLQDSSIAKIDLTGYIPTNLQAYKNECTLTYSGNGVDLPRNLFLLAQNFVEIINRDKILSQKEIVRVFLLFDGDVERSIKSLDSIFAQDYEYRKIFVVLMTQDNVGIFISAMKNRASQITFVNSESFQRILESKDGDYVQFVLPGDILHREKLLRSVEFMRTDYYNPQISFCLLKQNQNRLLPELAISFDEYAMAVPTLGNSFMKNLFQKGLMYSSALSRGFFKQELFEKIPWIQNYLNVFLSEKTCLEVSTMFIVANLVRKRIINFVKDELVENGCREWSNVDFLAYKNLCSSISPQLKE